jgi:hypothetical protein
MCFLASSADLDLQLSEGASTSFERTGRGYRGNNVKHYDSE